MPAGLPEAAYEMIHGRFTDEQREGIFDPEVSVAATATMQESCWGHAPPQLTGIEPARTSPEGRPHSMVLNKQEKDRLPATLKRSSAKAQATYMHTLESAEQEHGDGEAAHRIAFGSLKHSFEKVGDHWEPKDEPGPSDDQDAKTGADALTNPVRTAGGVNARATKAHLLEVATRLEIRGRWAMSKAELVDAIDTANRSATARAAR